MPDLIPEGARTSPSTARNRQPILDVLRPRLAAEARVLEVASGAGEHALFLAAALPAVRWQPSDREDDALTSIGAWRAASASENLAAPVRLDASDAASWPAGPFGAVVCINMVHISPWTATQGLMAGAARVLAPGGRLFLYGPYLEAEIETAASNLAFNESLKARDPAWGLRQLAEVCAEAAANGLVFAERIAMPANNLMVVFERS
jgi:SAM-dependent methyltransferase